MSAEPLRVLPRGRHAAPRDVVESSQRTRLLEAMAAVVADEGYAATSVAMVIKHAGVSRKTFYEHFANKEECFLEAYDLGAAILLDAIEQAQAGQDDPLAASDAGVRAYLAMLGERPDFARTFLVEALAAGPVALERRAQVLGRFADQFRAIGEQARREHPGWADVPEHRYAAAVGAANELVSDHVRRHGTAHLDRLHPILLDVLLTLLADAAR